MQFPPDVPNHDAEEPFTLGGMLKGWFSIMVPAALATYLQTQSFFLSLGAALVTPAVAIIQGSLLILQYRVTWGDSPGPLAPSHGVVVVNTTDASKDMEFQFGDVGCSCLTGRRWRRGGPLTESERQIVEDASNGSPLRILVIGDSLAIGVGSTRSCTPMMPEVIARTLSKALNGRAVYWSCHGAAGASTQWVDRELKRGVGYLDEARNLGKPAVDTPALELSDSSSEENSVADSEASLTTCESNEEAGDGIDFADWRHRLDRFSKQFEPDIDGPYDIAVVMSGANDLKSAFFPFLLKGEDSEFRKQAQERGGSFDHELRRVIETIQKRMPDKSEEQATTNGFTPRPLVVFPGMPPDILPIFQLVPNRWLSIPICGIMDNHKRNIARKHKDEVLFIEAPCKKRISEFEDQRGEFWQQRVREDTLLSLRSTTKAECQEIEGRMKSYYGSKGESHGHQDFYRDEDCRNCQYNPPFPKLSERRGLPGSKIIGVDKIHANDEGYDYWGRYIGNEILEAWRKDG